MFSLAFTLFVAGLLTILLPCILPLIPIVLGVSIAGQNRWRPLVTVLGMLVSFVGSTFLLNVVLNQFVELANVIQTSTYAILFLFGIGFLFHEKKIQLIGAVLSGFFFWSRGMVAVLIAMIVAVILMEVGGRIAARIQQLGMDVQVKARQGLGDRSLLTAFIVGITLGLVWVPCAGPALSFALALVRNQPGVQAALYLTMYALGAGIPLLIIGYGGQIAVQSVKKLNKYSGRVKEIAGALLILSALAFQFNLFQQMQTWFVEHTGFGTLGNRIEENLFGTNLGQNSSATSDSSTQSSSLRSSLSSSMPQPGTAAAGSLISSASSPSSSSSIAFIKSDLPILGKAPDDFLGNGPWHSSPALHLKDLKGKVVLIDFWTYSCINCIRTLPYIQGYWEKYRDQPFVLVGVHTPEFTFEKSVNNVKRAIKDHGLTYPVFQDNDFATWNAFQNRFWPAKYLIDAEGNIRYTHFGEGEYEETDKAIASLLREIGASATNQKPMPVEEKSNRQQISPEIYLHSRSWESFGNKAGNPDGAQYTYTLPTNMKLNNFYLDGQWQLVDDERQVLRSDTGKIGFRALAGEVNLVLGLAEGASPVTADITVDGKATKSITIDHHDLYNLFKGDYGTHDIILTLHGKGAEGFAFTFGQ